MHGCRWPMLRLAAVLATMLGLGTFLASGASAAAADSAAAAVAADSVADPAASTARPAGDLGTGARTGPPADPRMGPARAPDALGPFYFYRGIDYGSEALVHPLRMILNGGYGIMQVGNRDNHIANVNYRAGAENLWMNVSDPFSAIRHDGWGDFLREEIFPFSTSTEGARYWPNYTQHLIGGGMSYRMTQEWFRAHGSSRPGWWAVGTMVAYHVLNETVETSDYRGWTTDPVADLLVFDPGGILLFSSDRVSRFFGQALHMTDWSYQPAYDPQQRTIENIGQNYVLKYRLPRSDRWYLFYHWGTHGEFGMSYWREDGECFSAGGGFAAGRLVDLEDGVRTVDLVPSAGLFWDRHNSLMASLLYANTQAYRVRLNLYPGVVKLGGWSPGLFVAINRNERLESGITFTARLPLGLSAGSH